MKLAKSSSIMRLLALLASMLALAISNGDEARQNTGGVAAIRKVIQMLSDMEAKAKKEKKNEEVAFAEFGEWCKMNTAELKKSVEKATSSIEELGTSIDKLLSDAKTLGEEIGRLENQITKHEADMKAHKNTRSKEHTEYQEESKDYADSISALDRAISVLSAQDYDRSASSAALLQVSQTSRMPQKAKDLIASFLGEDDSDDDDGFGDYQAPEAHGYEFQSGSIVNVLKQLLEEFRAKKDECDKEEANAKHAFDMVMLDLSDTIAESKKDVSSKTSTKSAKQAKAASLKKEKVATESTKVEDESTLKGMEIECSEKTQSFNEKQELRTDEIEAIGKAIAIMSSSDVSSFLENGAASGLATQGASYALLRSGSSTELASKGKHRDVRQFVEREGQRLKSHTLSLLVQRIDADPFAKVATLINDMIQKLLKEANEDAEHEGFCDTEMGKSKETRTKLTEDIDSLSASIEDAKSLIMSLSQDSADLAKGIADLQTAYQEASKMRMAENKKNKETVADAEAAVKAVDAATAILKDFYEKASIATSLVQGGNGQSHRATSRGHIRMDSEEWDALANVNFEAPTDKKEKQTFGEVYKGNQDGATGVLAMLEVIRSDFANLASDTKASEEESLKSFEEFVVETKKNVAVKSKKMELNDADKAAAQAKMQEDLKDLKSTQEELVAAERYYSKLVPQCIDKGSTYEDRTKAREAEIQSLKEALKMLS